MNFREMETFIQDIMSPDINYTGAIFKLLLSLTLGAVIGYERRRKGQFAGLRTFALIAMGATLAMLISIYLPQVCLGVKNGDPGRIAAQVVSGVGFLGAGAIIQMKGSVRGLTTAAGIWMTASIGLAVGAGMYLIAVVATLLIFIMLHYIERVEHHVHFMWESKVIRIQAHGIVTDLTACREQFKNHEVTASNEFMKYDYENVTTTINFVVLTKDNIDMAALFTHLQQCFDNPISIMLTNEPNL